MTKAHKIIGAALAYLLFF